MSTAITTRPFHRGLAFFTIACALMMMAIDSTIVATALHTLTHDLHAGINWAGWTITAYSLGFLVMLPVTGKLAREYGRRRVFLASVAVFTAASLACALATNITTLVVLRALQAAGGAGFTPSATGLVVDHFGDERDRAVSLFGSIFPIGAVIGPIFGGLFIAWWSWRGIFLVNLPVGLAVLWLARRTIPPDPPRAPNADRHFDLIGMGWLTLGLAAGMFTASALAEGPAAALAHGLPGALLALAALALFVRHIRRAPQPFIAPRMIWGHGFGAVNVVNAIYGGVRSGTISLLPLFATNRYGIDALRSGTLLTAQGIATIVASVSAALLIRRTGYRWPIVVGGLIAAAGIALFAVAPPTALDAWTWLAATAFLVGLGGGALNPASRNAGLQLAPEDASTLAALRTMSLQVGTITTISLATAFLSAATDPGAAQRWVFAATAMILVAALPLVRRLPEYRGAW